MHVANRIIFRRDTEANWSSANPTLAQGEYAWVIGTNKFKIGDGTTAWNDLDYLDLGASTFEKLGGSPYDNSALAEALNEKASTGALETEILNRTNAVSAEATARQQVDTNLQTQINGKTTETYVDNAISEHNESSEAHIDIRQAVAGKQDEISDLDDIRSGALYDLISNQEIDNMFL